MLGVWDPSKGQNVHYPTQTVFFIVWPPSSQFTSSTPPLVPVNTPPNQIYSQSPTLALPYYIVPPPPLPPPPPCLLTTWRPWTWAPWVVAASPLQWMWTSVSLLAAQLESVRRLLNQCPWGAPPPLDTTKWRPQSQTCTAPSCNQTPPQRQRGNGWWPSWWAWASAAPGWGWSRPCLWCRTARCVRTRPGLCRSSGKCRVLWCSDFRAHLSTVTKHGQWRKSCTLELPSVAYCLKFHYLSFWKIVLLSGSCHWEQPPLLYLPATLKHTPHSNHSWNPIFFSKTVQ